MFGITFKVITFMGDTDPSDPSRSTRHHDIWNLSPEILVEWIVPMDFAARFCRNIKFCRPENTKITEKQVLKTQWIQSPESFDSLRLKVRLRRFKIAVNKVVTL